jgi:mono/diheme cytochrome c family protein/uncharacterized membrane protein
MATRRFPVLLCILAKFICPTSLEGRQLAEPEANHAQGDASKLFQQHCARCHGTDGTGSPLRSRQPEIPDFTQAAWQARRSDAQLQASILEGMGVQMPAWRGKVSEKQAHELAAYVRSLAPTKGTPPSARPASADERFQSLQKQLHSLQEQFYELSKDSPIDPPATPPEPPRPKDSSPAVATKAGKGLVSAGDPKPEDSRPPLAAAAKTPAVRELFQQHCGKCHGADGTGSPVRKDHPKIPDFAAASGLAQRSDAQMLACILDGKGKDMPTWRGKISEQQASDLATYVRAFAVTKDPARPERDPNLREPSDAQPLLCFLDKLTRWLGKLHPAAIHFPIALLTAAAGAEVLRLLTGNPVFDAASRYCIWFGTLGAVVAGALGWFAGGFQLNDASWVMTTHRWLGTFVVAWAALVLVLSEASGRPNRRRTRMCFRVALLVVPVLILVTGFLGGAVVFGLNHYSWPE